jgi:hypothetical protein
MAKPHEPDQTGNSTACRISSSASVVCHVDSKNFEHRVEGERHRGQLARRIRVRERSADGAAVADLEVADERQRPLHEGDRRELGAAFCRRLARGRAHAHDTVDALDRVEALDGVEVDEVVDGDEAQVHHRHEALPPGDHLRSRPRRREDLDRVREAVRRVIPERCRLHRGLPIMCSVRSCAVPDHARRRVMPCALKKNPPGVTRAVDAPGT